ncbi:hypothetical protein FF1_022804 [Malus domestica]
MTKGVFVEGLVDDCDDEASDPPSRSFLQRRFEEKSCQFEQMFSREVKSILEEMHDNSDVHNRLLKVLVNKVHEIGPADRPRQSHLLKNNPMPAIQAEIGFARLKMIDLEKNGEPSSRSVRIDRGAEVTPVDMVEV